MELLSQAVEENFYNIQYTQNIFMIVISHSIDPWVHNIKKSIYCWYHIFRFFWQSASHVTTSKTKKFPLKGKTKMVMLGPVHQLNSFSPLTDCAPVASSTPMKATNSNLKLEEALRRISELEQEIISLKKNSAKLTSGTVQQSNCLTQQPPPPPPPPPPNFFVTDVANNVRAQITKNRKNFKESAAMPEATTPLTSLAEVIKNAKGVKLRKVERSPGGTPLRKPPLKENDLLDILSRAMQKRYEVIHPKDDSESFDSSPEIVLKRKIPILQKRLSPLVEMHF